MTITLDGSDLPATRTSLGLGDAATKSVGVSNGEVIQADSTGLPAINGSQVTALTSANLTGALPAISGAALTALPATLPAASGVNLTALNATNLGSGTVPTARLGSGTASNSTFLRGDGSWASAGGDPGIELLDTTTASTAASVIIGTSIITASHRSYMIDFVNGSTSNDNIELRTFLGTGAGPTFGSASVVHFIETHSQGGTVSNTQNHSLTFFKMVLQNDAAASEGFRGRFNIIDPLSSTKTYFSWEATYADALGFSGRTSIHGRGHHDTTSPTTAVKFTAQSGTISGTFRTYGLKA